jgi:ABC-2 type transport system ATP-binding protein
MKLEIRNLGKRYKGGIWGLRDFSLTLEPGVLGLVGPNGAGKSTLLRILATVTKPTEGRAIWNGTDITTSPNALRAVLGYLPQDFGVYPHLNADEFLEYLAAIKGIEFRSARQRIEGLLQVLNLMDVRKRPLKTYSGGMKQRLGIAQTLLNDPQLLVVDEPTAGLDPEERVRFRNLLASLSGDRIVILSTHVVSDVEAAATDLVVIKEGRLLHHVTPERLLSTVEDKVWAWVIPSEQLVTVRGQHLITSAIRRNDGVHLRVVSQAQPEAAAMPVSPSLEDAYMYAISSEIEGLQ